MARTRCSSEVIWRATPHALASSLLGLGLGIKAGANEQPALFVAGPQAAEIDRLWWLYLGLLSAITALVLVSVAWAVLRGMKQHGKVELPALAEEDLPQRNAVEFRPLDRAGELRRKTVVGISSVATVLVLVGLLVESLRSSNVLAGLPTDDALEIEVTGKQWWWEIKYPSADPSLSITTANEIHIPVGRTVRFQLASTDVIHSFWVPSLHGKRDLIPGHRNVLELRADRVGRYRSQCAEFCGLSHAQMSLWVVVEEPADFERWRASNGATAHAPESDLELEGQVVFLRGPCASCHAISGTSANAVLGPDLSHVASRSDLAAASFPNRRGYLAGWLLGSQDLKPGSHMPNLQLSARELHALLAYLEALR